MTFSADTEPLRSTVELLLDADTQTALRDFYRRAYTAIDEAGLYGNYSRYDVALAAITDLPGDGIPELSDAQANAIMRWLVEADR